MDVQYGLAITSAGPRFFVSFVWEGYRETFSALLVDGVFDVRNDKGEHVLWPCPDLEAAQALARESAAPRSGREC